MRSLPRRLTRWHHFALKTKTGNFNATFVYRKDGEVACCNLSNPEVAAALETRKGDGPIR